MRITILSIFGVLALWYSLLSRPNTICLNQKTAYSVYNNRVYLMNDNDCIQNSTFYRDSSFFQKDHWSCIPQTNVCIKN